MRWGGGGQKKEVSFLCQKKVIKKRGVINGDQRASYCIRGRIVVNDKGVPYSQTACERPQISYHGLLLLSVCDDLVARLGAELYDHQREVEVYEERIGVRGEKRRCAKREEEVCEKRQ